MVRLKEAYMRVSLETHNPFLHATIANKKAGEFLLRLIIKDWRLPTLAEAIQPLPSARLCLTAVFGMGTGRTTALWPPKILKRTPKQIGVL